MVQSFISFIDRCSTGHVNFDLSWFSMTLSHQKIARKTDKGLNMMKNTVSQFCECIIRELREQVDSASVKR